MDATIGVQEQRLKTDDADRSSTAGQIRHRLYFCWVIACGVFSIMYTSSCYLLTGGYRREHSIYRKWNVRMANILFRATGIRVETQYRCRLNPSGPYIFVSNHQSFLDIPVSALAVPCPFGFVAKAELARIPFLGQAIKYSPSVFMDRSNPRKSLESMQKAADAIKGGTSVIMFPEGGRSYQRALRPFKKGAFVLAIRAGVPLVPVVIKDAYRVLNEKKRFARRGTVHVVVGEPISLEGMSRKDIPDLMERVGTIMRRELDLVDSCETLQDEETLEHADGEAVRMAGARRAAADNSGARL